MTSVGAFAGARWQKAKEPDTTSSITFAGRTGGGGGGGGTGGAGRFGGGGTGATAASAGSTNGSGTGTASGSGSGATTGKVVVVDGTNIYVTDASGTPVKVSTDASTKVSASTPAAVGQIKTGDTVTVQGTVGSDGTTAAKSITIAPAGTSPTP
jgi:hypothetical protein